MIKICLKSIFLICIINISLLYGHANCDSSNYISKSGEFKHNLKKIKVFNYETRTYDIKFEDGATLWPKNCIIDSEKLYMYSFRTDLKDRVLIQFIFNKATGSADFDNLADNLVNSEEFKKATYLVSQKWKNRKIVIEINAYHHERIYEYKNNKLEYIKTNFIKMNKLII